MLKYAVAILVLGTALTGCTRTETTPAVSSKTTQVNEKVVNNRETVRVEQPVINVELTQPSTGQGSTTKTESRTVTQPGTTTNTKVVAAQTPEPTQSPLTKEESLPEEAASSGLVESESTLEFSGSNTSKTVDAKGREVTVSGKSNHISLLGSASSLSVSGDDNEVTVINVKSINLNGKNNKIVWSGEKPQVSDSGTSNQIAGK
jgi:hypothetical protein